MPVTSTRSASSTDHPYYPVFLDLSGKPCVVIGGGRVAERKVRILLRFGAAIRTISPKITRYLAVLHEKGRIEVVRREYEQGDLAGMVLAFACTDIEEINSRVSTEADQRGIPVNVADNPSLCSFIVPSIVRKGPIVLAISTSGTIPLLSKKLRKELGNRITTDYVKYARILGRLRRLLLENVPDRRKRREVMRALEGMEMGEIVTMGTGPLAKRFLGIGREAK
jgi:precorrin-2 dehydrogenase/sirohydrochlorin ferrochelatase